MTNYEALNEEQVAFYNAQGYLVLEKRIPDDIIAAIRADIARFEDEARGLEESNDRIDLEDSHTPENPRVRRIQLPHTTSEVVNSLMYSDHILAPVRDLIGPDLRIQTAKLNMKSAGYGAPVEWHQDFAFYPHTNDDVLAIGVIIDDMRSENGPLMVFPGSHKGPIFDHHVDGVFAGAMNLEAGGLDIADAVELKGPAGSISIHHGRIIHGSAQNRSRFDRRLLLYEIMAADAFPITGGMTIFGDLDEYNSRMLCGKPTLEPRVENVPVRIPQPQPENNRSIYETQSRIKNPAFTKVS
jgi:ectoine hydroxylase-related dioxygenase (phytanoyl-CoA dioxygenase family)